MELSKLFDVIKAHKEQITFPLKIENIERIYKWSNLYVHSGKCELSWIPYYIETILKELSFGQMTEHSWDVKNGITTTNEVIEQIYDELLVGHPKRKIYACKPECVIRQELDDAQNAK